MANASEHPQPIGELLRQQRVEKLGKGLREMAGILGIAPAHLTDIEKGRRNPSEELLIRIADSYRIPIANLRSGWSRPEAIVKEVASQNPINSAKVPEFLRTARNLNAEQWDRLIQQAKGMKNEKNPKKK